MSTDPLADAQRKLSCAAGQVSLVVNLSATPSARLIHELSAVLGRCPGQPCTFLGSAGDTFNLNLRLSDPGLAASEALARRLLRIKGVQRIRAERVCVRRGSIYAISLKASAWMKGWPSMRC